MTKEIKTREELKEHFYKELEKYPIFCETENLKNAAFELIYLGYTKGFDAAYTDVIDTLDKKYCEETKLLNKNEF